MQRSISRKHGEPRIIAADVFQGEGRRGSGNFSRDLLGEAKPKRKGRRAKTQSRQGAEEDKNSRYAAVKGLSR
jgi:hypothetical protein